MKSTITTAHVIEETYKAYIGNYPSKPTVEYLQTEIDKNKQLECVKIMKTSGKMQAQLYLINDLAEKYVHAKKLGITLK